VVAEAVVGVPVKLTEGEERYECMKIEVPLRGAARMVHAKPEGYNLLSPFESRFRGLQGKAPAVTDEGDTQIREAVEAVDDTNLHGDGFG
jgi:hypothetical protein